MGSRTPASKGRVYSQVTGEKRPAMAKMRRRVAHNASFQRAPFSWPIRTDAAVRYPPRREGCVVLRPWAARNAPKRPVPGSSGERNKPPSLPWPLKSKLTNSSFGCASGPQSVHALFHLLFTPFAFFPLLLLASALVGHVLFVAFPDHFEPSHLHFALFSPSLRLSVSILLSIRVLIL